MRKLENIKIFILENWFKSTIALSIIALSIIALVGLLFYNEYKKTEPMTYAENMMYCLKLGSDKRYNDCRELILPKLPKLPKLSSESL